ncbi:MAG: hypothetical protein IPL86_15055 [Flavobacteriales bacterium]|nr:hypothetical protein [Flavobacteriales bacterium]
MDTQSKLELHYYLEGGVHSMDAFGKNSAEAELLKIFHEVSVQLDLDLSLELEALEQAGLKEFIKVLSKKKSRRKMWTVLAFLGGILTTVVTNVASDYLSKDHEFEELQKEELRLHIQKLKRDRTRNLTKTGRP